MKTAAVILLFAVFYGLPIQSQTPKTGKAIASGICGVSSHSGNNDTVNINIKNCGIGAEQGRKIIELLQRALADTQTRDTKLNQLIELASKPTVTVEGPIIQSGGNCTQNIVGGSGNTNQCTPEMLKISEAAKAKIASDLADVVPRLSGSVSIHYDFTADGGTELAQQIQEALAETNVQVTSERVLTLVMNGPSYPGLSLGNVTESNKPIADALDRALRDNGIIAEPLKRLDADPSRANGDDSLWVIIRKP